MQFEKKTRFAPTTVTSPFISNPCACSLRTVSAILSLFYRYKLAENIDVQLKRMAQDLKEVIEHLNSTSGGQETADPVSLS